MLREQKCILLEKIFIIFIKIKHFSKDNKNKSPKHSLVVVFFKLKIAKLSLKLEKIYDFDKTKNTQQKM